MSDSQSIEYRPILNFPAYRVGSDGSVWSRYGKMGHGNGGGTTTVILATWRQLKPAHDKDGYFFFRLRRDGKYHNRRVPHLVLEAFVGPRPAGMESAHENGNPADNRPDNLRWATHVDNCADKKRHGTSQQGEKHPMHKLTDDDVREIKRLLSLGLTQKVIAAQFRRCPSTINHINTGRQWSHVT